MFHEALPGSFGELRKRFLAAQERAVEKSKSLSDLTFEEFMGSPAMGFGGAGAIKSIKGLSPGIKVAIGGRSITPGSSRGTQIDVSTAGGRANLNRPVGEGSRRNIGGRKPPDAELEASALRRQQAARRTKGTPRFTRELLSIPAKKLDQIQKKLKAAGLRLKSQTIDPDNPVVQAIEGLRNKLSPGQLGRDPTVLQILDNRGVLGAVRKVETLVGTRFELSFGNNNVLLEGRIIKGSFLSKGGPMAKTLEEALDQLATSFKPRG